MATYKFVFRIRKRYFDLIVAGTKTVEYRRDSRFWQVRIENCCGLLGLSVGSSIAEPDSKVLFMLPLWKFDILARRLQLNDYFC